MNKADIASYIEDNKERFIEELFDLIRIPSVSADPAFKEDVQRAANYVENSNDEVSPWIEAFTNARDWIISN